MTGMLYASGESVLYFITNIADMRVPVIMQISRLFVFTKGILTKNYLKVEIDINHLTFKYILKCYMIYVNFDF